MTSRVNDVVLTANQRLRDQLEELSYSLDESLARSIERDGRHHIDDKGMTTDYAAQTKVKSYDMNVLKRSLALAKMEISALKRQIGDASRLNRMSGIENHIRDKSRQLQQIQHESEMAMKLLDRDSYYENEDPAAVWLNKTTADLHKKISEERALLSDLKIKCRTVEECLDDKREICMKLEGTQKEKQRYQRTDESADAEKLKRQLTALHFAIEDDKGGALKKLAQLERMKKELQSKLAIKS